MYIICKKSTANLQLIDKLIVSPDTSTVYGELYWLTWPQNQEASGLKQRLIVCLLSVTEWLLLDVAKGILIRAYKFRTANTAQPPLRIFVSQNSWHHFAERWDSRESGFRNIVLRDTNRCFKRNFRLNIHAVLLRNAGIYLQITQIHNQVHCHINIYHLVFHQLMHSYILLKYYHRQLL